MRLLAAPLLVARETFVQQGDDDFALACVELGDDVVDPVDEVFGTRTESRCINSRGGRDFNLEMVSSLSMA